MKRNKNKLSFEIGTIVFTALAFFIWISIFSYRSGDPSAFTASSAQAMNACGIVGAYLSSVVLQVFGLGAFFLPVAFLFIAVIWQEEEKIGKYEQEVMDQLAKKREELFKPIFDRFNKAMSDVAKEKGFMLVFDTNTQVVLYADESLDVTKDVKTKLGITN